MAAAKVTITDVAKTANVSVSTVSRILNKVDGKIKISETTRQRVLDVALELGFSLNPFASALRTHRTGLMGVVIRDIADPFLVKLLKDIQWQCQEKGVELFISNSNYDIEKAYKQLGIMLNHWFDGLIILENVDNAFLDVLSEHGTPYVLITGDFSSSLRPVVHTNDKLGIELAIDHLIQIGHRNIGFIGNQDGGVRERLSYFRTHVQRQGLTVNKEYIEANANSKSDIERFLDRLLHSDKMPTGIVCATDLLAIRLMNCAMQHGLQVPKDISVIGFDDIEMASEHFPTLTTIQQALTQLSSAAIDILLNLIEHDSDEETRLREVIVEPTLIIRQSTASPDQRRFSVNG